MVKAWQEIPSAEAARVEGGDLNWGTILFGAFAFLFGWLVAQRLGR